MRNRNLNVIGWLSVVVLVTAVLAGGCRDRSEYEPPGYAPPPPPPPPMAANTAPARLTLVPQDPTTFTPKLTDPEDAKGKAADLKSAIAGIWEDQLVIKIDLYGEPPKSDEIWYLAWLVMDPDPELFKVQFSLASKCVTGGIYIDDSKPIKDVLLSGNVEQQGNSVIARFPWGKIPEKYQVRDLRMESVSVIRAGGKKPGSELIDVIEGHDMVRL